MFWAVTVGSALACIGAIVIVPRNETKRALRNLRPLRTGIALWLFKSARLLAVENATHAEMAIPIVVVWDNAAVGISDRAINSESTSDLLWLGSCRGGGWGANNATKEPSIHWIGEGFAGWVCGGDPAD